MEETPSKLSRVILRDSVVGTFDDLERAQQELDEEMRGEKPDFSDTPQQGNG